jgi:hypothetical protein
MQWFYGILAGSTLLLLSGSLFLASKKFAGSRSKRRNQDRGSVEVEAITSYIDESLRGYPDRIRYTNVYGAQVWTCHSRLFTFQITFQEKKIRYRFQITFFCKTPFRFRIRRAIIGTSMRIERSSGKRTAGLLAEKEIPALIRRLRFYDSVEVSTTNITGTKIFSNVAGLAEWPQTIGASITFVRFLLNHEERKESTKQGEALCPYCKSTITDQEKSVSCNQCRTIHHQPCWNETDRCSVFGCGGKSELEL